MKATAMDATIADAIADLPRGMMVVCATPAERDYLKGRAVVLGRTDLTFRAAGDTIDRARTFNKNAPKVPQ